MTGAVSVALANAPRDIKATVLAAAQRVCSARNSTQGRATVHGARLPPTPPQHTAPHLAEYIDSALSNAAEVAQAAYSHACRVGGEEAAALLRGERTTTLTVPMLSLVPPSHPLHRARHLPLPHVPITVPRRGGVHHCRLGSEGIDWQQWAPAPLLVAVQHHAQAAVTSLGEMESAAEVAWAATHTVNKKKRALHLSSPAAGSTALQGAVGSVIAPSAALTSHKHVSSVSARVLAVRGGKGDEEDEASATDAAPSPLRDPPQCGTPHPAPPLPR